MPRKSTNDPPIPHDRLELSFGSFRATLIGRFAIAVAILTIAAVFSGGRALGWW